MMARGIDYTPGGIDYTPEEEQSAGWKVFSLSCLDHPNIAAELAGERPPIPSAVGCSQINQWVRDWCLPVTAEEREATDIEWPPGSGKWWRPGPEFESRCLGLWPSSGTYGVWSDALWRLCTVGDDAERAQVRNDQIPEIGVDVARFGDDMTTFHVRWGNTSFHHEWVSQPSMRRVTMTAGRAIQLAQDWCEHANRARRAVGRALITPADVPIKIDDDGVGGGVTDVLREQKYTAIPVNAGSTPMEPHRYPDKRCELWFATASAALDGDVWLGRLPPETLRRLRAQAMAPVWWPDARGRRVVEPKDATKEKIGRSPDDMDALNLAYYSGIVIIAPQAVETKEPGPLDSKRPSAAKRRGMFGR